MTVYLVVEEDLRGYNYYTTYVQSIWKTSKAAKEQIKKLKKDKGNTKYRWDIEAWRVNE